jgi:hypothetical protein
MKEAAAARRIDEVLTLRENRPAESFRREAAPLLRERLGRLQVLSERQEFGHSAIKSGMLAAEAIFEALVAGDFSATKLQRYEQIVNESWITGHRARL